MDSSGNEDGCVEDDGPEVQQMKCPNCTHELGKKLAHAEHVDHCRNCNTTWFILQTSRKPKEVKALNWDDVLGYPVDLQFSPDRYGKVCDSKGIKWNFYARDGKGLPSFVTQRRCLYGQVLHAVTKEQYQAWANQQWIAHKA